MTDEEVAQAVDAACEDASSFLDVGRRLEETAKTLSTDGQEPSPLDPFVAAFRYDLAERTSQRREEYGPFVPMIETVDYTYPPRLEQVGQKLTDAWASLVSKVKQPPAQARLNDLLWSTRHGPAPHEHARAAIAGYSKAAVKWTGLDRVACLSRALELSVEIKDGQATSELATATVAASQAALDEAEKKPGIELRLIQSLAQLPRPPIEVDDLLERAEDRYDAEPSVCEAITEARIGRARGDTRRVDELQRAQLERWRREAEATEGLTAVLHLQHGVELARRYGLADEAERFLHDLQGLDRDSLSFERLEAEATVDADELEELVRSLVQDDWPSSLRAFGATGPPSGDVDRNTEFLRELMRQYPFSFLVSRTVLGPENTVIRNIAGEDEHLLAQLAEHETRGIVFWGQIATEGFRRIEAQHGPPPLEPLQEYFSGAVVAPELADAFARGVLHYCEGRYDESALVVLPRIEAVIRELGRRAGLVVIREPQGVQAGGVRPLGPVLRALQPSLDESWWRYLWSALVEPLGLNLRNRLLHGIGIGTQVEAAVAIHIACFLALLKPQE